MKNFLGMESMHPPLPKWAVHLPQEHGRSQLCHGSGKMRGTWSDPQGLTPSAACAHPRRMARVALGWVSNESKNREETAVMSSFSHRFAVDRLLRAARAGAGATLVAAALGLAAAGAAAQTYGVATMPPGTLNHTTGSAIAKVLKEKGGLNVLVQPTAGESSLIPMVGRAEAELGIANIAAVSGVTRGTGPGQEPDLRLVGSLHALRAAFFVRKDSDLKTIADLKGKRVTTGYSAMRTVDTIVQAMLASAGLGIGDVTPVPVPNVVRGADDFLNGNADTFMFGFGA